MVKSSKPSQVFASELVHLGYGHPLWYPEPTEPGGEVRIGDVGYIDDGRFHRLFNACFDKNHSVNACGVPDVFTPLKFPQVAPRIKVVEPGDPMCSVSAHKTGFDVQASAPLGAASIGGGYSLSISGKRGAVAILKDGGTMYNVSRSTEFRDYILRNHMSWHEFARRRQLALRVQDIVLVSGVIKTAGWALAEYSSNAASHEASVSVNVSGVSTGATFSCEASKDVGLLHREGPSGLRKAPSTGAHQASSDSPQDQCVFVQYYKCYSKVPGIVQVKMPQNLDQDDVQEKVNDDCFCTPFHGLATWFKRLFCGCCRETEPESELDPPPEKVESMQEADTEPEPVEALLDYVMQHSPKDVNVVSHEDVYELFKNVEWPASVVDYLKKNGSRISIGDDGVVHFRPEAPSTPTVDRIVPPTPPSKQSTLPPLENPLSPRSNIDGTHLTPEPVQPAASNQTNRSNSSSTHSPVTASPTTSGVSQNSNASRISGSSSQRAIKWKSRTPAMSHAQAQLPSTGGSAPLPPITEPKWQPPAERTPAWVRETRNRAQRAREAADALLQSPLGIDIGAHHLPPHVPDTLLPRFPRLETDPFLQQNFATGLPNRSSQGLSRVHAYDPATSGAPTRNARPRPRTTQHHFP